MALKIEDITMKHPFIYEVGENLYYMGQGVFRVCTEPLSCTYFERYKKCIQDIGSERIEGLSLTAEEIDYVIYCYRKVRNYSEFDKNVDNPIKAKEDILNFISSLSTEELAELEKQLKDFVCIFKNYYHPRYPYN